MGRWSASGKRQLVGDTEVIAVAMSYASRTETDLLETLIRYVSIGSVSLLEQYPKSLPWLAEPFLICPCSL